MGTLQAAMAALQTEEASRAAEAASDSDGSEESYWPSEAGGGRSRSGTSVMRELDHLAALGASSSVPIEIEPARSRGGSVGGLDAGAVWGRSPLAVPVGTELELSLEEVERVLAEAGGGALHPADAGSQEGGGYAAVGTGEELASVSHRSRSNTIEMQQHFEEEVDRDLLMMREDGERSEKSDGRSRRGRASSVTGGSGGGAPGDFGDRARSSTLLSCDIGWVIDREAEALGQLGGLPEEGGSEDEQSD